MPSTLEGLGGVVLTCLSPAEVYLCQVTVLTIREHRFSFQELLPAFLSTGAGG